MYSKVRIFSPKKSFHMKNSYPNKSLSMLIGNLNLSNHNITKLNQIKTPNNKSNSFDDSSKRYLRMPKDKRIPKLFNFTFHKNNSQGSLYIHKSSYNYIYQKMNSNNFNEVKSPKMINYINYQMKKKKNYLDTYGNYFDEKSIYKKKNNQKTKSSLAFKRKNLSQSHQNLFNFEDFYFHNIFKGSRNNKKGKQRENINYDINKANKNIYTKYDKTKCVIERKLYGETKQQSKCNNRNSIINQTYGNNKINQNNKWNNLYNETELKNSKLNIDEDNNMNSPLFLEDLNDNIKTDNKNINLDKKIIYSSMINKFDTYYESSQESTNQIGNSNKYTISKGYRMEKFISGFLDGPEDIHYRFVELHKQRKMFYEGFINKIKEEDMNLDNKNEQKTNMNDFDICEYSEYFENLKEVVPII